MTVDELVGRFATLSLSTQSEVLLEFAHGLTILARDFYSPGLNEISPVKRLREINEIQHRVIGAVLKRLSNDSGRYPDDVLVKMIVGDDDDMTGSATQRATLLERVICRKNNQEQQ